jgi:MFS family permease
MNSTLTSSATESCSAVLSSTSPIELSSGKPTQVSSPLIGAGPQLFRAVSADRTSGPGGAAACFLLTGFLFATWASRIPAIKADLGITEGQLAVAFIGLNAGAILGLQLGGLTVPRLGSRRTLTVALLVSYLVLLTPALASRLLLLVGSLFALAAANSVVDVAMNAQGVAVERGYGRPVLSSMHAMHSLGGIVGAGLGALAAGLQLDPFLHFVLAAVFGATACMAVARQLLPTWVDAARGAPPDSRTTGGQLS